MLFNSKYKERSDEHLMILIKDGDHRAFSILYDRYAPKMKAYFFRMLWSNDELSEDYLHDLFTKIIERPESFKSGNNFSPWIYQVASNMCKNAYRKRAFELEYLNQLEKEGIHFSTVDKKLDEEIMIDQIHILLDRLHDDRRAIFLQRYQQELTLEELATIHEVSIGTIKSRLFYIKKTLVDGLTKHEITSQNDG